MCVRGELDTDLELTVHGHVTQPQLCVDSTHHLLRREMIDELGMELSTHSDAPHLRESKRT